SSRIRRPTRSKITGWTTTITPKRRLRKGRYAVGEETRPEHAGGRDGSPGPRRVPVPAREGHARPRHGGIVRRPRRLRPGDPDREGIGGRPGAGNVGRGGRRRPPPRPQPRGKPGL